MYFSSSLKFIVLGTLMATTFVEAAIIVERSPPPPPAPDHGKHPHPHPMPQSSITDVIVMGDSYSGRFLFD